MSILSKLQRLAKLSPWEWMIFIQLILGAAFLDLFLRFISLPRLVYALLWGSQTRLGAILPLFQRRVEVHHLFDLSAWAARLVRGPECCLPRSLLLFWLLSVRREPVTFCIGVRKEVGTLHSHAWVETPEGKVIGWHQEREVFQPLLRFSRAKI